MNGINPNDSTTNQHEQHQRDATRCASASFKNPPYPRRNFSNSRLNAWCVRQIQLFSEDVVEHRQDRTPKAPIAAISKRPTGCVRMECGNPRRLGERIESDTEPKSHRGQCQADPPTDHRETTKATQSPGKRSQKAHMLVRWTVIVLRCLPARRRRTAPLRFPAG